MGFSDVGENNEPVSFQETFEQKREEHRQELQRKEDEMRQTFVLRVKEKETELKEAEKDVSLSLDDRGCLRRGQGSILGSLRGPSFQPFARPIKCRSWVGFYVKL